MNKIFEKTIQLKEHQIIELPINTAILSVIRTSRMELKVVCEIDTSIMENSQMDVFIVYANEEITFPSRECVFIGSVDVSGNHVHVFVKPRPEISA